MVSVRIQFVLLVVTFTASDEAVLRAKRGYQTDSKYRWDPTQPIPYFFDPSLRQFQLAMAILHTPLSFSMLSPLSERQESMQIEKRFVQICQHKFIARDYVLLIRKGLAIWQNSSCLDFVENPNGISTLRFFLGPYCFADLGRQGKRTQDVSIGVGCNNLGTVMHEINHAIGFFHEVSRPDRNESVIINYDNVKSKEKYNFVENAAGADNSFNVPYDYGSVMQYEQYAFANNTDVPTIVARNKWMQNTMRQRAGAAFSDVKQVNLAFQCGAKCPAKSCANGGIVNSRDCAKCLCPRGFAGDSCDSVAKGDAPVCNGGTLIASIQSQTIVASVGTDDFVPYAIATNCYWIINAPLGKKVAFTLIAAPASCVKNCVWQGIEIILGSFDTYGITMCCPSFIGQPFIASGNMVIVRGFARSNLANFSFQYSFV